MIGHAVRVGWQERHPDVSATDYGLHKGDAWDQFYRSSPAQCRRWQLLALQQLTEEGVAYAAPRSETATARSSAAEPEANAAELARELTDAAGAMGA